MAGMTTTIELRGLELHGHHGVEDEERRRGQRFLFDLWLEVPEDAARTDRVEDAVDYREVVALVREISGRRQFHLLESLAAAVADAVAERWPVAHVRVRVRKPDVKLELPAAFAAVSVERGRSRS